MTTHATHTPHITCCLPLYAYRFVPHHSSNSTTTVKKEFLPLPCAPPLPFPVMFCSVQFSALPALRRFVDMPLYAYHIFRHTDTAFALWADAHQVRKEKSQRQDGIDAVWEGWGNGRSLAIQPVVWSCPMAFFRLGKGEQADKKGKGLEGCQFSVVTIHHSCHHPHSHHRQRHVLHVTVSMACMVGGAASIFLLLAFFFVLVCSCCARRYACSLFSHAVLCFSSGSQALVCMKWCFILEYMDQFAEQAEMAMTFCLPREQAAGEHSGMPAMRQ